MIEKKYSDILLLSSFSMLFLSMFLLYLDFIFPSILYFLLFVTSINHWKNPNYDLKRIIDIFMVFLTTMIGMVYATKIDRDLNYAMYHITAFYCLLLFILSNLLTFQQDYMISTLLHSKIHLICFIGNSMMFYHIT